MDKLFYPAVFHKAEEGGFWVSFPDFPECLTEGDDVGKSYAMAVDALGLSITTIIAAGDSLPDPSDPDDITAVDGFIVLVEFDLQAYKRRTSSVAVKRTVSLPAWLATESESRGYSYSQVLQEALLQKIGG
ncbi:type II toxin-antitoxin system HicB family antitoxin [Anaerolentibacter hominis]|uniref:type II toxin-antitoxin system HicB family antitoxin n=1 Tax=Anaerolentibacter hominis TaxID=3079009 RepID=UPI0031B823C2